ncbi:unnamed protein product [Adineta ricciae]|uniref:Uncharacterized protein n=1 Tax=Adineta ricciae TaxID=249248 RepID=A0A813PZP7_ADIRI|nr:unnamed protein product [Adineta ricciae]CAF0896798.1 unnamed protein product [Adineta ricciae]
MFFLIAFAWHVAASFAFVLAILTYNWITVQILPVSANLFLQQGVFYVCTLTGKNSTYTNTQCASIIGIDPAINSTGRWDYNIGTASASVAIACAGLSVIIFWLCGIYFNIHRKRKCRLCLLVFISILLFITFCASFVVWILEISETLVIGYKVDRSVINWPLWLAVGSTGGYLMAFVTTLIHLCSIMCRRRDREVLYKQSEFTRNQF